MTPAEAKTKWCPFARVLWTGGGEDYTAATAINRNSGLRSCCLAYECMAWRWEHDSLTGYRLDEGYCGLAGREGAP